MSDTPRRNARCRSGRPRVPCTIRRHRSCIEVVLRTFTSRSARPMAKSSHRSGSSTMRSRTRCTRRAHTPRRDPPDGFKTAGTTSFGGQRPADADRRAIRSRLSDYVRHRIAERLPGAKPDRRRAVAATRPSRVAATFNRRLKRVVRRFNFLGKLVARIPVCVHLRHHDLVLLWMLFSCAV